MCLFRRKAKPKEVGESRRAQQAQAPTRLRGNPKAEDSSLDLSGTLSKESRGSRNSQASTGSAISLASLKGVLSDGAQIFTYKDVLKATENFTPARKLGSGTFRGRMAGRSVAVVVEKRVSTDADFVAEVRSICNLHHSSLAKLIGGCISGDQLYLVYEFVAGANLRQCLCSPFAAGFTTLKSWTTRLRVALDVAKGLEYLHDHGAPPFVHKYIKSTSILLDDGLHARIANVGVARIRGESTANPPSASSSPSLLGNSASGGSNPNSPGGPWGRAGARSLRRARSVKITGTHGYMAPEYSQSGVVTPKLDVFAFGVVLLEILSGQEPVKMEKAPGDVHGDVKKTVLADVVAAIFTDREPRARIRAWMDPLLRDAFPLDCACRAALLARRCVDADPETRPPMQHVALCLEQIYMASQQWEHNMLAAKGLVSCTLAAR